MSSSLEASRRPSGKMGSFADGSHEDAREERNEEGREKENAGRKGRKSGGRFRSR